MQEREVVDPLPTPPHCKVTIAPLTMNLAGQLLALGRAEMAAVLVYALAAPADCSASRNPVESAE